MTGWLSRFAVPLAAGRGAEAAAARPAGLSVMLVGVLALGAALLAADAPGGAWALAARGALCAAGLAAGAILLRRSRATSAAAPALRVVSRAALTREAGVALVEVHGCPQLVGYGPGGVQLLAAPIARPAPGAREDRP